MLAEKVETEEELQEARHLRYSFFQGYFFCRPSMVSGRDIPAGGDERAERLRIKFARAADLPGFVQRHALDDTI